MASSQHKKMKSELKKLLETLELSKNTTDPEQAQEMLDRLTKFKTEYGDAFDDALKNNVNRSLQELDEKLESEEDRLSKIIKNPRKAFEYNLPDNQIKPGWTFTNAQMNFIEGVNLLQTDASLEYNIQYTDGSVSAVLDEKVQGEEEKEESSYPSFRPPPPKDDNTGGNN